MNWSKAKTILIVVFLIVNIFLVLMIGRFYFKDSISNETIDNALQALKERRVTVNISLPEYIGDTGKMNYFDTKYNKLSNYEDKLLKSSINISNDSEVSKYVKESIKKFGIPAEQFYVNELINNNDGTVYVVMNQKYKDFIIFDSYIKAIVSNRGIKDIEYNYKSIKGETSKKKIMPAYQVLLKNFKLSSENIIITDIDIGYKENILEAETKDLNDIPVWRVKLQDGKKYYFKAYTGDKI